jgi:hypothetical protein
LLTRGVGSIRWHLPCIVTSMCGTAPRQTIAVFFHISGTGPKPTVTVFIDTYNHCRFIEEAIVSALEQSFPRTETKILVPTKMAVRGLRILRISIPGDRACPYCGEKHLHRSGQSGLCDSVLDATPGLRPHRCVNCDRRHHVFASSRKSFDPPMR